MHEKPILFFGGWVRRRVNRLKKGAWIVCRSKTGLGKKRRGDVPEGERGRDSNAQYELEEPSC